MAIFQRISFKDRTFVTRQLAVMIESGLPVAQAVRYLSEQTKNPLMQEVLMEVLRDLENGYKFSDAAKKHPKVFNNVFIAVAAAGESSGRLSEVLNLLATEEERELGFRSKVLGALLYPSFIVCAMIIVAIIVTTRVIPPLLTVFTENGVDLPWNTKILVAITNSLMKFWYLYIVGAVGIGFFISRFIATDNGRRELSSLMLKIPAVNALVINLEMTRLTRVLGMLVKSGVPIISAIHSVADILQNTLYSDALHLAADNVERGAPISPSLSRQNIFPNLLPQMVGVGEQTGKLEEVLAKLASYYESELDQSVRNVTALTEPVIFVIVGLGVAFLVFSVIIPIYDLASQIQ